MAEKIRILTSDGPEFFDSFELSDEERSIVGGHWSAIRYYHDNDGDDSRLREFEGTSVAGRVLLTNPDEIDRWARRGELDFEDIYED